MRGLQCRDGSFGVDELWKLIAVNGYVLDDVVHHVLNAEDEETCVPEEFAGVDEHGGKFLVRLLGEGLDSEDLCFGIHQFVHLHISVSGFWARRRHAHGDNPFVLSGEAQSLQDVVLESMKIMYLLVGRGYHDACIGTKMADGARGPRYRSEGSATYGFSKDLAARNLWQLFLYQREIGFLGADENVFRSNKACKAFVSLLNQCAARSFEVHKLFRTVLPACGPEAAAQTASKDEAIVLFCFVHDI